MWLRHLHSAGAQSAYRERSLPANKNFHPHNIKDVAALVGVTQRTLRFYEEIYLISPQRSTGTRRRYSDADVVRLQRITHFAHLGFSLAEVKLLLSARSEGQIVLALHRRHDEVSAEIKHLQQVLGDISDEIAAVHLLSQDDAA
ncbi:MAG: MerR family transcriptional regulator [Alphaproteobacteria bacterium]|nr:MAG: MerR family transcriptional regulator [Alphaproteobacteria bacterium]